MTGQSALRNFADDAELERMVPPDGCVTIQSDLTTVEMGW